MPDLSETMAAIGRVRRAMPRNPDVMLICDELDKRMTQTPLPLAAAVVDRKIGRAALATVDAAIGRADSKVRRAKASAKKAARK